MKKKTKLYICAALFGAATLHSCLPDTDNEYHTLNITYPYGYVYYPLYADQTADSLCLQSTEGLSLMVSDSWIKIDDKLKTLSIKYTSGAIWNVKVPFSIEPNTTGKIRSNVITVKSDGASGWQRTITQSYKQAYFHNITQPVASVKDDVYSFTDTYLNSAAEGKISFTAYGDWTLTQENAENSFAHIEKTSGQAGTESIVVKMDGNTTADTLTAVFNLTSNGVTTPITLRKAPAKK